VLRAYKLGDVSLLSADGEPLSLGGGTITLDGTALSRDPSYAERPVEFAVGPVTLSGTPIIPPGPPSRPAAVVLAGAGTGQRDFNRLLIGPALDAGVAVLIYDKQGHGKSTGRHSPDHLRPGRGRGCRAGPARPRTRRRPRPAGHSGVQQRRLARRCRWPPCGDVTFLAGIGVAGVSQADAEVHRRTTVLRDAGVSEPTVDATGVAWRAVFTILGAGTADEHTMATLSDALDRLRSAADLDRYEVPAYARHNPALSAIPPLLPADHLRAMLPTQADPELTYDPALDYAKLTCRYPKCDRT
jgi:hypothetical protein